MTFQIDGSTKEQRSELTAKIGCTWDRLDAETYNLDVSPGADEFPDEDIDAWADYHKFGWRLIHG